MWTELKSNVLTFLLRIWSEVLFLSLPFRWKNWRFDTNAWLPNELKSRGVSCCKKNSSLESVEGSARNVAV